MFGLRSWASITLVIVAGILFCAPASADPTSEDHDRARAFLADGRTKRSNGDHAGALESFKAAHEIEKLSTTGFEVGRTLSLLGRLVEARELLSEIAKAPPNSGEPPPLTAARADARELVDALERRIPTLAVKLDGSVDATVTATIDGSPVAVDLLGQARRLDPGDHIVIIHKGRGQETFTVKVAESETRTVTLKVPQDPDRPLDDPKPPPTTPTQPRSPERSHTIAWIAGAVGVAGIALGSTTGAIAASRTPGLERRCPNGSCPTLVHDDLREANSFALASTISFVVVGVAVAVVVWDLVRSPSSTPKVAAAPATLGFSLH